MSLVDIIKITVDIINIIIGSFAICGAFVSLGKIFCPKINIPIISSFYHTLQEDKTLACVIKIVMTASVDLVIRKLKISVCQLIEGKESNFITLEPCALRKNGFIPVMLDGSGNPRKYKLLKSIEPYQIFQQTKAGANSYYIALRSKDAWQDNPIKKWKFEITLYSPLFFVPNWFGRKNIVVIVDHPEGKDLYFDDDLIQKITEEEAKKQIESL